MITVKLLIRDNSICLRLTRDEVDGLYRHGVVNARTRFPGGRSFRYAIESSPAIVNPSAFYSESEITVRVPESSVLAWATTEQVTLAGEQRLGDGEILSISVVKDAPHDASRPDAGEASDGHQPNAVGRSC